jgi:hypothetical protein
MTTKLIFRHPLKKSFIRKNKLLGICFVVLFSPSLLSQTTIYSQTFSGTLAGSGWTNANLTTPWGNGSFSGISNVWQVSDSESGLSANVCGASGMGDQSLYMGATAFATGAAYLSDVNTNRRISSANISTVGYTNIILDFDFIGNGEGTTDKGYFVYSINGGTAWISATGAPTSVSPTFGSGGDLNNLKSQLCSLGQGLWTHVSWNMPVSCAGITNLRVGFIWQSNNNSVGTDPSFAVDDVVIKGTITPTPIELISFSGRNNGEQNELNWITATETNNDYFSIERSIDAVNFKNVATIDGAGNSAQTIHYNVFDEAPLNGLSYYRLKQTDYDGKYSFSNTISLFRNKLEFEIINVYNSYEQGILEATINCSGNCVIQVELYDIQGKKIFSSEANSSGSVTIISIPMENLGQGIYLLKAYNGNQSITRKIKL